MSKDNEYTILKSLKEGVATRLLDTLSKKGYKNSRKPYYVDTSKFANELEVSNTMLRRYLSGSKLPTLEIIERAAKHLDVDPMWLYCGYKKANVDLQLLKYIIKRMLPLFIKSYEQSPASLDANVNYLGEIYEHISIIENSDELERNKLIGWMLERLLKEESTHAESSLPIAQEQ